MKFPRTGAKATGRRGILGFGWAQRQAWMEEFERPAGQLLRYSRRAMACRFEILLPGSARSAWTWVGKAFQEIHRLEAQLSVFIESSEVSRLNRSGAGGPARVQPELLEILELGQRVSRLSDGAFDLTSAPLSRCWGFLGRQGEVPSGEELATILKRVGWRHLEIDRVSGTVYFRRPLEVNLGAIGKGYALDRAGRLLREGQENFLIHAGHSTILVGGDGPERGSQGWTIGLRDPRDHSGDFAEVRLKSGALSTSGAAEQKLAVAGRDYGHIIDPRTGYPAITNLSATALAQSAALADALSTAFYIMTVEQVEAFCLATPGVGAILVPGGAGKDLGVRCFGLDDRAWEVAC